MEVEELQPESRDRRVTGRCRGRPRLNLDLGLNRTLQPEDDGRDRAGTYYT